MENVAKVTDYFMNQLKSFQEEGYTNIKKNVCLRNTWSILPLIISQHNFVLHGKITRNFIELFPVKFIDRGKGCLVKICESKKYYINNICTQENTRCIKMYRLLSSLFSG